MSYYQQDAHRLKREMWEARDELDTERKAAAVRRIVETISWIAYWQHATRALTRINRAYGHSN